MHRKPSGATRGPRDSLARMTTALRRMACWLLLAVLPLQALSAAAMSCCGGRTVGAATAAAAGPPSPADCHGAHATAASHARAADATPAEPPSADAGAKPAGCALCAACLLGAALLPAETKAVASAGGQPVAERPASDPVYRAPARLERPPRA